MAEKAGPTAPNAERVEISRNDLAAVLDTWMTLCGRLAEGVIAHAGDKAQAQAALRRMAAAHRVAIGTVTADPLLLQHGEQMAEVLQKTAREGARLEPYRPTRRPQPRQPRER